MIWEVKIWIEPDHGVGIELGSISYLKFNSEIAGQSYHNYFRDPIDWNFWF